MKLPDKIYIQLFPDGSNSRKGCDWDYWSQYPLNDTDVEYIRADLMPKPPNNALKTEALKLCKKCNNHCGTNFCGSCGNDLRFGSA